MKIAEEYKKDMIENIKDTATSFRQRFLVYRDHLPDLPKPSHQGYSLFRDLWLTYPYDRNLMRQIEKLLASIPHRYVGMG